MNRSKTVHLFCLNEGEGLYNGKSRSVFVLFCENGTITLYCHMPF